MKSQSYPFASREKDNHRSSFLISEIDFVKLIVVI